MKLLTNMAYAFIEKMNAIGDYYVEKTKLKEKEIKEAMDEFGYFIELGKQRKINLPSNVMTRFAKCRNAKQVKKLNQEIKQMNNL